MKQDSIYDIILQMEKAAKEKNKIKLDRLLKDIKIHINFI
jgi:hypothetical protein